MIFQQLPNHVRHFLSTARAHHNSAGRNFFCSIPLRLPKLPKIQSLIRIDTSSASKNASKKGILLGASAGALLYSANGNFPSLVNFFRSHDINERFQGLPWRRNESDSWLVPPASNGQSVMELVYKIIGLNTAVFLAWRLPHMMMLRNAERITYFLSNHFIADRGCFSPRRMHALFLSAFSHFSFSHFLANNWGLYTLGSCLNNEISAMDFLSAFTLSAIASSVGQILLTRNAVLGASGGLMGIVVLEASLRPRDTFVSIFPIPGLHLTSIQLCQLAFLVNFGLAVRSLRYPSRIAWIGHISGFFGGCLFCWHKRNFTQALYYGDLLQLSKTRGSHDWWSSYRDCVDSFRIFQISLKIQNSSSPLEVYVLKHELERIKQEKLKRRTL